MKEEPASRPLSRRTLLKRVVHGLGVTLALGHVIPRVQAEERDVLKNETDRLTVRVARPLDAETPVQEFASYLTPNSRFFVRSHFGPPPAELLSDPNWKLSGGFGGPTADVHASRAETIRRGHSHGCRAMQREWPRRSPAKDAGCAVGSRCRRQRALDRGTTAGCLGASGPADERSPRTVSRSGPPSLQDGSSLRAQHPDTILAYQMNGRPLRFCMERHYE